MRILYGVSGVGLGHATRSEEIISHLERKGHKVLVFAYGEAHNFLKRKFNVFEVEGAYLYFDCGALLLKKSIIKAIATVIKSLTKSKRIIQKVKSFSPEICITDMEPITSLISKIFDLPLVSVGNYNPLSSLKNIPSRYRKGSRIANIVCNLMVPKPDEYLILSFSEKNIQKKVHIVDPVIRNKIINLKSKQSDFILVYATKLSKDFEDLLKTVPEKFVVYSYAKKSVDKNLTFKKISPSFVNDLQNAKAIIGTAGFSLISESLFLKKPFFAIPLEGHFEQMTNALILKRRGFGNFSKKPSKQQIEYFIKKIPFYKNNLRDYHLNPKEAQFILDEIIKKYGSAVKSV